MCKFNSRLFVFLVVTTFLFLTTQARPSSSRKKSLLDLLSYGNDFDLKYDQRQKGNENFRLKLDGFFIGVPAEATGLFLSSEELIDVLSEELLLSRHPGGHHGQTGEIKSSSGKISASDLVQKQIDDYQRAELAKAAEQEEDLMSPSSPTDTIKQLTEGRGSSGSNHGGSRTKLYIMNLIDYIRKNRHN